MNYTNLFDRQLTFVRGRHEDGSWLEPFDPTEWGGPFTEGDSWQWTWSVFQDLPGLVQLMNGESGFGAKLDAVLTAPNSFKVGSYGRPIHEMTEMVALDMGQYAHGNEPIHHMLYLYDYARQPWKAQSRLRTAMTKLYQATPDGMCGDEDTGQMSAWYVFSALGFYPVCPGTTAYMIGSPLFNRTELKLAGGKTFAVVAHHNAPQRPYIRSATLNGAKLERSFLNHDEIVSGGELVFEMQSAPDYHWATGADACPPSAVGSLTTAKQ
jgi:predicted alpha-1,2-mannosidase